MLIETVLTMSKKRPQPNPQEQSAYPPVNVNARFQRAISLYQANQLQESEKTCQQILKDCPQHAEALHLLGVIAYQVGENKIAVGLITQAIEMDSNIYVFFNSLGNALQKQGRLEESIQAYQKATHFQPNYADVYSNLGVVLKAQGRLEESIRAYQKAIEIQPQFAEAYYNLSNSLRLQGKLEESIKTCQKAIEIQPDYAEAHKNLGIIFLLKGNLLQGWKEYEWRWRCNDINFEKRNFPQPFWDGTHLNDKSILVWAEQGIGDEVMFASMFDNLCQMNADVIVECKDFLVPLFQRSFPEAQFFPRENSPNLQLLNSAIDYQIPMGSLGQWFRVDENSFKQSKQPYLVACTDQADKIKTRYQKLAEGRMLVGISWKSTGINQRRALLKSTMLEDWVSILSQQDYYFVNLQYGDVRKELEQFQQQTDLIIYQDEEIDPLQNLDDFAAQVAALDLVISASNSTVHMAGALGKQVWTLLSYVPDWRWMLEREGSPWYPSMRLFRQSELGDWSGVFAQVQLELERYVVDCVH